MSMKGTYMMKESGHEPVWMKEDISLETHKR